MTKPLTLATALSLSLLFTAACVETDSGIDPNVDTGGLPLPDEEDDFVPRDAPPTDVEQRAEQAIRARLVADVDPTRWTGAGFTAEGYARFATPSGNVDETGVPTTIDRARGDGILVLADGRKFRQRREAFERSGILGDPSERDLSRSVIGSDTRTTVAYTDYTKYPWRATGTIMSKKTDTAGWCTASMIGPRLAITAGHCVYDKDTNSWNWNTWFSPGHRGTGADRFPNGQPRQVVGLYSFDGWFEDENTEHDVGFLILADAPNTASLGWFGFTSQWSASDHEGITATTLQYPGWSYPAPTRPTRAAIAWRSSTAAPAPSPTAVATSSPTTSTPTRARAARRSTAGSTVVVT